jgi:hypothetical protein
VAKGSIRNVRKVRHRVGEESIYKEGSLLYVGTRYRGTFDFTSKVRYSEWLSLLVTTEPSLLYKLL